MRHLTVRLYDRLPNPRQVGTSRRDSGPVSAARLTLRAGQPARGITFIRTSDKTCAMAVVFASLKIRHELPLNEPVIIEFTPDKAGEITFACGKRAARD